MPNFLCCFSPKALSKSFLPAAYPFCVSVFSVYSKMNATVLLKRHGAASMDDMGMPDMPMDDMPEDFDHQYKYEYRTYLGPVFQY